VEIGRVVSVGAVDVGGGPKAKISLNIAPKYIDLIPSNVQTDIKAATPFWQQVRVVQLAEEPGGLSESVAQT
jgi:ABC-type transporter Mla subunit MlaD